MIGTCPRLVSHAQGAAARVEDLHQIIYRRVYNAVQHILGEQHLTGTVWLATQQAAEDIAARNIQGATGSLAEPSGVANLQAILDDQPYMNSALSVHEIKVILANEGGFMPDEATVWFRAARGNLGSASQSPAEGGAQPQYIVTADWSKLKRGSTAMEPTLTVTKANLPVPAESDAVTLLNKALAGEETWRVCAAQWEERALQAEAQVENARAKAKQAHDLLDKEEEFGAQVILAQLLSDLRRAALTSTVGGGK